MTEGIKNDIDKLDGMTKIKGKCGYEIIGGCSDLRRLEQENKELKKENRYYKTELKLSCDELDKSNNWQTFERREKNKYRSALEEINLILDELKQQYDYMTDYSEIKEIQDKINGVLQ